MSTRTAGWLWVAGQFTALGVLLFLPWRTPNPLLLSIGAVVALGGGFLGLATSRALGDAFTPSPVPSAGSGLRTTGVYSVIRHPMYAAVLLIVIGVLIAAGASTAPRGGSGPRSRAGWCRAPGRASPMRSTDRRSVLIVDRLGHLRSTRRSFAISRPHTAAG